MQAIVVRCFLFLAGWPLLTGVAFADFLYVSNRNTHEVLRFDSDTGDFVDDFVTAGSGGLNFPAGLTFGPDGNLYVASRSTSEVLRYDGTSGSFIDVFAPSLVAFGIAGPTGIKFGPDGNLYVAYRPGDLVRFDGTTGAFIDYLIATPPLVEFMDLEFGPDGNLYFMTFLHGVLRYDGTTFASLGTFISPFLPFPGDLFGPTGLEFGVEGDLYVSNQGGQEIKRYDGETGAFIDVFAAVPSPIGGSTFPAAGITFGPDGDVFFSKQTGASRVLRADKLTGALVIIDPANSSGLSDPSDIVFQPRQATEYGCGLNPDGSLVTIGGLPSIGSVIVIGVDNPLGSQAPGSLPLAFISTDPDPAYPCGQVLPGLGMGPGPGELLIDLTPPNPLLPVLIGPPWVGPGTPAPLGIVIPPSSQLVNQTFYFQGALVDPSIPSGPKFRLTGALAVRITP